jgi:cobalt/nickel transport system ATP-binding protein
MNHEPSVCKHNLSAPFLELRDIFFVYPGAAIPALDKLNFIPDKGKVGLIGSNGSGKTTLFHVIMGLLKPNGGQLFFKGTPMVTEKDFRELRREVGLLFQDADDQLFSPTVLEDVAFGPLNLGMSPAKAREAACLTLSKLGLSDLEERVTHHLSGGEKKLVSLATILVMEPKLLLLDEPTNNLDSVTRMRLIEILSRLELSCIIISHDWDFLAATTDEIYAMENGRLIRSGKSSLHNHFHVHLHGGHPHEHGG